MKLVLDTEGQRRIDGSTKTAMATYSNYALRVPASLMDDLRSAADRDGVSMNGFIVQAVAEKVAALRARGMLHDLTEAEQLAYLEARAVRGRDVPLKDVLAKAGTTDAVLPGDELPQEWLEPPVSRA